MLLVSGRHIPKTVEFQEKSVHRRKRGHRSGTRVTRYSSHRRWGSYHLPHTLPKTQDNSIISLQPDVMPVDADELDVLFDFKRDPEVGAVVVGFDKHFSYPKLVKAATYAHDPKIQFLGTNPDVERPSPNNSKYPGYFTLFVLIRLIFAKKYVRESCCLIESSSG